MANTVDVLYCGKITVAGFATGCTSELKEKLQLTKLNAASWLPQLAIAYNQRQINKPCEHNYDHRRAIKNT